LLTLVIVAASGCFSRKNTAEKAPPAFTVRSNSNTNLVFTPTSSPVGRIASVNAQAKFAVISFPIGQLPANETRLSIFHAGAKSGEIKITGPAQESFTVGDIIAGSAQEGDEVRAE
jgi:hypothetical protein